MDDEYDGEVDVPRRDEGRKEEVPYWTIGGDADAAAGQNSLPVLDARALRSELERSGHAIEL